MLSLKGKFVQVMHERNFLKMEMLAWKESRHLKLVTYVKVQKMAVVVNARLHASQHAKQAVV